MGKNNKQRRAAKARTKAKERARRRPGGASSGRARPWGAGSDWSGDGGPLFTEAERARNLLLLSARSQFEGDGFASEGLRALRSMPVSLVDHEAESVLLEHVDTVLLGGWQPAELHRQGRRGCSTAAAARLVAMAMATDHVGRRSVTLDSRWVAQVEQLGLPGVNGRSGWVAWWIADEGLDRMPALVAVVDALANLGGLPRLEPVLPLPGAVGEPRVQGRGPTGAGSDPVLDRIRGLLAKAESSTFEAEAIAFTAKAQELMTRHAIDAAMVDGPSRSRHEQPVATRLPIDPPYVDVKSLLLQTVAEAGRCRAVFQIGLDLSTVVGFPDDVAAVELLFTSLLLQAQSALADAARRAPAGARPRSQSYRSAFLLAYTDRIGARLHEINEAVYAEVEADRGSAFLPVLRSRSGEVDDFIVDRFGEMVRSPVRGGYDAAGWANGRLAADRAQLTFGDVTAEAAEPEGVASSPAA